MNNYFIIHGFMGSNIENWFPWLKEQIDNNIKNGGHLNKSSGFTEFKEIIEYI